MNHSHMLRSLPQSQFDQTPIETVMSHMFQDYPSLIESFTARFALSDTIDIEKLRASLGDLNHECLSGNIDAETEQGIISALQKDLSDFFQKF